MPETRSTSVLRRAKNSTPSSRPQRCLASTRSLTWSRPPPAPSAQPAPGSCLRTSKPPRSRRRPYHRGPSPSERAARGIPSCGPRPSTRSWRASLGSRNGPATSATRLFSRTTGTGDLVAPRGNPLRDDPAVESHRRGDGVEGGHDGVAGMHAADDQPAVSVELSCLEPSLHHRRR